MTKEKIIGILGIIGLILAGLYYLGFIQPHVLPLVNPVTVESPTDTHFDQNQVEFKFSFDFDEQVAYELVMNGETVESFDIAESATSHEAIITLEEGTHEWRAIFEKGDTKIEHSDQLTVTVPDAEEEGSQVIEDLEDEPEEDDAEIGDELEGEAD